MMKKSDAVVFFVLVLCECCVSVVFLCLCAVDSNPHAFGVYESVVSLVLRLLSVKRWAKKRALDSRYVFCALIIMKGLKNYRF